jgi:hypothetical protein
LSICTIGADARISKVIVEYRDKLHLAFRIETDGELDGTLGIGVFTSEGVAK